MSAVTFAADPHHTAVKPSEALHAEHNADGVSAVSGLSRRPLGDDPLPGLDRP
jgi:hypothetical protein